MIGNDVVDLKLAARESNWRRKGFMEKVFTTAEQEVISSSAEKDITVWLLWSMKEAAYKAHQRFFNLPRRLNWLLQECRLQEFSVNFASGMVHINGSKYSTTSEITSEYIHTSAEKDKDLRVEKSVFEGSSSEAKKALILRYSAVMAIDPERLKLEKDAYGMPFLGAKGSAGFQDFSLSGHGRYSAYNLSLINCETSVKHS